MDEQINGMLSFLMPEEEGKTGTGSNVCNNIIRYNNNDKENILSEKTYITHGIDNKDTSYQKNNKGRYNNNYNDNNIQNRFKENKNES